MQQNSKKFTFLSIVAIAIITTASTISPRGKFKNLKILPQDISEKKLDSIMDAYSKALKVNCDFCHVPPKKDMFNIANSNQEMDYSLDNDMKEKARNMMRLTIDINKKYFYNDSLQRPEYLRVVHCNTCHRGNPIPPKD
jgi:hypothetical protein